MIKRLAGAVAGLALTVVSGVELNHAFSMNSGFPKDVYLANTRISYLNGRIERGKASGDGHDKIYGMQEEIRHLRDNPDVRRYEEWRNSWDYDFGAASCLGIVLGPAIGLASIQRRRR